MAEVRIEVKRGAKSLAQRMVDEVRGLRRTEVGLQELNPATKRWRKRDVERPTPQADILER